MCIYVYMYSIYYDTMYIYIRIMMYIMYIHTYHGFHGRAHSMHQELGK